MQSASAKDITAFKESEILRLETAYQSIPEIELNEKEDEDSTIVSLQQRKEKIKTEIAKLTLTGLDQEAFAREVAIIDDLIAQLKKQLEEDGAELGSLMNQSVELKASPFTRKPNPAKNRALVSAGAVVSGGAAGLIGACSFSVVGFPLLLLIAIASLIGGLFTHAAKRVYDSCQNRRVSIEDNQPNLSSMQSSPSSTAMMMGGKFPGRPVKLAGDRSMAEEDINAYQYPIPPTPPVQQSQAGPGLSHRTTGTAVRSLRRNSYS